MITKTRKETGITDFLRDRQLSECAFAVEQDKALKEELAVWDVTLKDGLTNDLD